MRSMQVRMSLSQQRALPFRGASTGFDNAVVCDMLGNVAELATSNIFMAKDGVVFTPWRMDFSRRITRRRVIGLLRQSGVTVVEKSLTYADFEAADEIFASGNYSKVVQQPGSAGAHSHSVRFLAEHENSIGIRTFVIAGHSEKRSFEANRRLRVSRSRATPFLDRGARVNPMPTSTMVEVLTPIWQRVLQLPSVGADDNFSISVEIPRWPGVVQRSCAGVRT